jgi:hypothetical protein
MAVVSYVRAVQTSVNGAAGTGFSAETRVWQRNEDGRWLNVHMHRSMLAEKYPLNMP